MWWRRIPVTYVPPAPYSLCPCSPPSYLGSATLCPKGPNRANLPPTMTNTPTRITPTTVEEDVRRSSQREPAAPRLRSLLSAEGVDATHDQPRQLVVSAFAGPADANLSPAPVFLALSGSPAQQGEAAQKAPPARKKRAPPKSFENEFVAALERIEKDPPTRTAAAVSLRCRAVWKEVTAGADRADRHFGANVEKLTQRACALLGVEPPMPAQPTPRSTSGERLHLPDHRLIAGAACNDAAWEDTKIIVWGLHSTIQFCDACREHNIDTTGWAKIRGVEAARFRVEVLCANAEVRRKALAELNRIHWLYTQVSVLPGRRFTTRAAQCITASVAALLVRGDKAGAARAANRSVSRKWHRHPSCS